VLFGIARELLGRILFPLGDMPSKRERAREGTQHGPGGARQARQSGDLLRSGQRLRCLSGPALPRGLRPGPIVDSSGKVLGRHRGIAAFTIGQRKGLGVAGKTPLFVTHLDAASATITVGPRSEILHRHLRASQANWHCDPPAEFEATVQVRYNHAGSPARVRLTGPSGFEVDFAEPVMAVTPGQAAVCYEGDRLLGGGWIQPFRRLWPQCALCEIANFNSRATRS
jgi:tRNA-specific 2-thiouridylase